MTEKPQHVNPGLDVTWDPTFHPDTYRERRVLLPYDPADKCELQEICSKGSYGRNPAGKIVCCIAGCKFDTRTKTSDALAATKDRYPFGISDDDFPAFNQWLKAHDQQVRKGGRS